MVNLGISLGLGIISVAVQAAKLKVFTYYNRSTSMEEVIIINPKKVAFAFFMCPIYRSPPQYLNKH